MAIQSFSDKATEEFFISGRLKPGVGWRAVRRIAKRKLGGHHSIRINDQWRIVFIWADAGPTRVRVVDYH